MPGRTGVARGTDHGLPERSAAKGREAYQRGVGSVREVVRLSGA